MNWTGQRGPLTIRSGGTGARSARTNGLAPESMRARVWTGRARLAAGHHASSGCSLEIIQAVAYRSQAGMDRRLLLAI
jgi:hypothetical protein